MDKMVIDSLVVEITRRCNANCAHCLRGCAENVNISRKAMRELFNNIKYVNTITFTGGEPSLYVRAIRETLNICKELEIEVGYIYVVTNGVKYSKGLINVMNDWANYCMKCMGYNPYLYKDRDWYFSEGIFGLSLSIDEFHPSFDYRCWEYKELPYYSSAKEIKSYNGGIILEGRAADNFSRGRVLEDYELTFSMDEDIVELLYCNCFGEIFPCCNMSYDRQREISGVYDVNVLSRTLQDIVFDENVDYTGNDAVRIAV